MIVDSQPLFAPPVKHSVTIDKHQTSISLEPVFWHALNRAAREEGVPVNALISSIDEQRIAVMREGSGDAPNLASAIRCWLWGRYCDNPGLA
jgi:predicted DNA-binding ribbon-helix-helix protein